jgi:hypothetical protein
MKYSPKYIEETQLETKLSSIYPSSATKNYYQWKFIKIDFLLRHEHPNAPTLLWRKFKYATNTDNCVETKGSEFNPQ